MSGQLHTPGRFIPGTDRIGAWVDLIAGLDNVEKKNVFILPGIDLRPLARPPRSHSLYTVRYPGP
jgi:hypothetical protein